MRPRRLLLRIVTPPLFLAVSAILVVEEALWRSSAVIAWIGKFPVFRQIEQFISNLPPYPALACFALPAAALAPVKLLALYWLAGGHPGLGIGTIIVAKIAGTALVARIFQLTRPALLTVAWFRSAHGYVNATRHAIHDWWRGSAIGRWIIGRWRRMKSAQPGWLKRRWLAIRARRRGAFS